MLPIDILRFQIFQCHTYSPTFYRPLSLVYAACVGRNGRLRKSPGLSAANSHTNTIFSPDECILIQHFFAVTAYMQGTHRIRCRRENLQFSVRNSHSFQPIVFKGFQITGLRREKHHSIWRRVVLLARG
jgi:hypothetical protein